MKRQFVLQYIFPGHFDTNEEKTTMAIPKEYETAEILTGNHVAHRTGYYEPCLLINRVKLTRAALLKILVEMSEMELEENKR